MSHRRVKTIRNAAIYYTVRVVVALLGRTPGRRVRQVSRWLGGLAFFVAHRERRIAIDQLCRRTTLGKHPHRAKKITRGVFNHLALCITELCRFITHPNNAPPVFIPDASRRALDDALSHKRGVIFVTGHIGNWELMAMFLARQGYPIHTVARTSYDNRFTRFIAGQRARFGVNAIYREQVGSAARLLRVLKKGHILGMLIDQDTRVQSVFVPFFGLDAYTPGGAATFALHTGTPVVVGSIKRTTSGRHTIRIRSITLPDDEVMATARLTDELERRIRGQMSQWVWFHKRWKTRKGV
ncbi:MAG: lysophospholipid acyltransferase family protein [Deltaproteobacteria bacterium]|nr:lysophospholipid acyltransferase family protein [Deltaproteobacteria bacterium]